MTNMGWSRLALKRKFMSCSHSRELGQVADLASDWVFTLVLAIQEPAYFWTQLLTMTQTQKFLSLEGFSSSSPHTRPHPSTSPPSRFHWKKKDTENFSLLKGKKWFLEKKIYNNLKNQILNEPCSCHWENKMIVKILKLPGFYFPTQKKCMISRKI